MQLSARGLLYSAWPGDGSVVLSGASHFSATSLFHKEEFWGLGPHFLFSWVVLSGESVGEVQVSIGPALGGFLGRVQQAGLMRKK